MENVKQINCWTLAGFENGMPIPEALETAKRCGYEGLEVIFGAGVVPVDVREKDVKGWLDVAEKLGMKMESVASGNFWTMALGHPDAARRREAVGFMDKYLRFAGWLGVKVALTIPGWVAVPWDPNMPVIPYDQAWELATDSIWRCIGAAERANVVIGIENVWNWFLSDPVAMRTFVDQYRHPLVGVYFDVANCLINGFPEHWLKILRHRVAGVHFKNFRRQDCAGGLHGFGERLDDGDVNWPEVCAALEEITYDGPITAELMPFSRMPDSVIPDIELARSNSPLFAKIIMGDFSGLSRTVSQGSGRIF